MQKTIEIITQNVLSTIGSLGWNQTRFAKELDWTPQRVSDFLNLRFPSPELDTLEHVSKTLGIGLPRLLELHNGSGKEMHGLALVTHILRLSNGLETLKAFTADNEKAAQIREIVAWLLASKPKDVATVYTAVRALTGQPGVLRRRTP